MLNQRPEDQSVSMFRLVKWYGDCVTDEGHAFIGYWAELRWKRLQVRYGSRLEAPPGGTPQVQATIRAGPAPIQDEDCYSWAEPLLGVDAQWKPKAAPYATTLFAAGEGEVRWSCLASAADVEVRLSPGERHRGQGYLERLELTLPPWSLPIDTLYWGRYLAQDESLVWIDWRGAHQRRLVLRKGQAVEAAEIGSAALALQSGEQLACDRGMTLREGSLGPNVLSVIRGLERIVPLHFLQAHEHKWLSRGELSLGQRVLSRGWVIHEVVSWRNDPER